MGKLGKCCCVGDCLTPFDCDTWQVNWDGYTPTINNSWQIIENTTASGNTLTASKTGTCGGLNVGSWTGSAYFTYNWQYRLRIRKGHTQTGLTCGTWPTGFTAPSGNSLIGGSDTGISTYRTGSQCYAVFHVGIEVYIDMVRTVPWTQTISGFTGPRAFCNASNSGTIDCNQPGNALLCFRSTAILAYSSEPKPYTVLADLNGTHTLYRNPGSCSAVGPTNRAALRLPIQSEVDGLIPTTSCFAICPVPFRISPTPWTAWAPISNNGSVLPSTMDITLGGCRAAGVSPD